MTRNRYVIRNLPKVVFDGPATDDPRFGLWQWLPDSWELDWQPQELAHPAVRAAGIRIAVLTKKNRYPGVRSVIWVRADGHRLTGAVSPICIVWCVTGAVAAGIDKDQRELSGQGINVASRPPGGPVAEEAVQQYRRIPVSDHGRSRQRKATRRNTTVPGHCDGPPDLFPETTELKSDTTNFGC